MASNPPNSSADASNAPMDEHDALPPGTRFGELEILRVLGVGGFGIVYLAQDHALERNVALKEYMPGSLAARGKGQMVSLRSGAHTETYALGLRSFVNEARLLARFNHPSLVKVYRFWEENGTAYMVMPYLQGRTLRDARRAMDTTPSEEWVRSIIDPMLDALELLHLEDVYHRDIAPDNILLPPGELPVLLDFGAARRAIGDSTQTFTAILKPSYAPIEQYAEVMQLRQGPWTDVYALGAVIYYLLRGSPPPPATARAVQDDEPLLVADQNPGFSPRLLSAVEWALAIRPKDRPQSITALRNAIEGHTEVPVRNRSDTTPPSRPAAPPAADAPVFATTLAIDPQSQQPEVFAPAWPMTAPQPRADPPPPNDAATAWPATQPVTQPFTQSSTYYPATQPQARTRPEVTVMPAIATIDTPPPASRRRFGVRIVAAVAGVIGVGAMAAWMTASRPSGTQVAAPDVAASAPVEPAALPTSAKVPATAAAVGDQATSRPVAASPAARAKPNDKPTRSTEAAAAAFAHREEVRAQDQRHAAVRDENPRTQASTGQPAPAVPTTETAQGPASPREACGHRVFFAMAICMEEQCERPRFKTHPQCERVREIVERRRRGEGGG